jgi:hypothetical protein
VAPPPKTLILSMERKLSSLQPSVSRAIEFLYLGQAALAAEVFDMRRAMKVLGEAQALFAKGEAWHWHKVVLRNEETVRTGALTALGIHQYARRETQYQRT